MVGDIIHIVYEDGAWSVWQDGRIIGRFHTREEAVEFAAARETA